MSKNLQSTETKGLQERRNTTASRPQGSSHFKRSSSVQQNKSLDINPMMAKTAPQGFFKQEAVENPESPLMYRWAIDCACLPGCLIWQISAIDTLDQLVIANWLTATFILSQNSR